MPSQRYAVPLLLLQIAPSVLQLLAVYLPMPALHSLLLLDAAAVQVSALSLAPPVFALLGIWLVRLVLVHVLQSLPVLFDSLWQALRPAQFVSSKGWPAAEGRS